MITFHNVRWRNFLSAGNQWTEISLDTHKNTLIMGHNGAGKSTFLDALTFCLFGKPFRKVNKGNVVNSINNKNCVVEIEFTHSNRKYKVVRGAKPNIFEIYCEGKMINQDAATKDYQEHLEKHILRMNYKSFTQVVILGSASFVPFMQLSANDRRAVIEDLLDIQIFTAMSNIVKNRLQMNKEGLEKNRVLLTSKSENKSYIERTLASLRANNEEKLIELEAKKDELTQESIKQECVVENLKIDFEKATDQDLDLSPLKSKHSKLVGFKAKMEGNRERVLKENFFYRDNDTCPTCKQDISHDHKFNAVTTNDKKIVEYDEALNKIEEQINSVLSEIEHIDEVLQNINKIKLDLSSAKATYNNTANNLRQIVEQIESFSTSDKTTQESERQLQVVQHDISTLEEEKKALLDDRQYVDLATTLLKDGGIKTRIIKQYLPIINKHINKYLAKLGFFVNFNINESFEEIIKSRHRDEFSYNNFSEGEKLRIDLAILLTWRQIAKMKNSVNVNILVFDEILDRAMDATGIDEFIKIMWDMGDKGTNIFVISHKDTMIDRFQRTLRFEKVKNFSVLTNDKE
jgi:DNA repair exonuclease SbcCD ATPase subunit